MLQHISIFTCSPSLPTVFVYFYFDISVWSPCLRSSMSQTWKASSMRPFTMPCLPLTTPRSLLMPASSITPPPKQRCQQFSSPSPLKGITCNCVQVSRSVDSISPQQQLRVDARPTKSGRLLISLWDSLLLHQLRRKRPMSQHD